MTLTGTRCRARGGLVPRLDSRLSQHSGSWPGNRLRGPLDHVAFFCLQAKQSLATLTKDVPKRHSLAMPGETVLNGNQEWVVQADLPLTAAIRQSQQTLYHSHPPHPADRQGESWPRPGSGGFWGGRQPPSRGSSPSLPCCSCLGGCGAEAQACVTKKSRDGLQA